MGTIKYIGTSTYIFKLVKLDKYRFISQCFWFYYIRLGPMTII